MIRFRPARESDLDTVHAIETVSFSDPWSAGDFRQVMSSPQTMFLVAEKDERVDGYAIAMFVEDEAELLNIAVTPERRGGGVGDNLLRVMLGLLGEKKVRSVFLEVRESNAAARALYEKAGFVAISKRKKYYRNPVEDALILRLEIKR
jgi:ribosomal-protein-alanine N-acetyltransferase